MYLVDIYCLVQCWEEERELGRSTQVGTVAQALTLVEVGQILNFSISQFPYL